MSLVTPKDFFNNLEKMNHINNCIISSYQTLEKKLGKSDNILINHDSICSKIQYEG